MTFKAIEYSRALKGSIASVKAIEIEEREYGRTGVHRHGTSMVRNFSQVTVLTDECGRLETDTVHEHSMTKGSSDKPTFRIYPESLPPRLNIESIFYA